MKKYLADWTVKENILLRPNYCLIKLGLDSEIPEMLPGQFVQVRIENSPSTFLRRPISIHFVDRRENEIRLLVQLLGEGTRQLAQIKPGDRLNLLYPLGNGFSLPEKNNLDFPVVESPENKPERLLIGGGVGIAPLLYLGFKLSLSGCKPVFLLGAKRKDDLLQLAEFEKYGKVYTTTEDGSYGEKGFVTQHSVLRTGKFDFIYTCGPKPMMQAVAKYARKAAIPCEVSLENTMACGIGACLCCVEKTKKGNICVCTEGPVFNSNQLTWQI
ncbi:MAG: dihydroorotate dehydrogenase electron transfer subunit [Dysgonamonadaceae bacterium]|jgi:dihydroorotate dehydrogenase electron transfer subunit|nr:dihydroorotate dehydrogenase electron transfer subunit [Dysgonamonadaceae bacterium]